MKRFVALSITILIIILPLCGVFANSNPEVSGFEFVFSNNFPDDSIFRSEIEVDFLSQIETFEETFGIKIDSTTIFNIFPCESKSYNINVKKGEGVINCIASKSFKDSIGQTNPIFTSIIQNIWPKCPTGTNSILSLYLSFKYLNIDPIHLAAEIRYAFSDIPISLNPDTDKGLDSPHINTILLAATRIYKLESEIESFQFKNFLYSSRFGISKSLKRYFGLEFITFVRSLKYETKSNEVLLRIEPSEDTKILLHEIDSQGKRLWKDIPQFASNYDYRVRIKPSMSLFQTLYQIAKGQDENEIKSSLSLIDNFFSWRNTNNKKSWIILLSGIITIMVLLFLSLIKGIRFKPISNGKQK